MSGSGGGGGGGFDPLPGACDELDVETQLSSPKDEVVATLHEGDVLQVVLATVGTTSVVVVRHHGRDAGGLAFPQVARLRECIAQGTAFVATVLNIDDGQVRVRVTAA